MNVTQQTWRYIAQHPTIKDCILKGLINYSQLARQICADLNLDQFDAVLVACRRYARRRKDQGSLDAKIRALVERSKLRIRSKVIVARLDKQTSPDKLSTFTSEVRSKRGDLNIIEGEDAYTVITTLEYEPKVKSQFSRELLKLNKSLVQIVMLFDHKIESTPGIVSYAFGLLFENGVNVVEEMSCWNELMFIVNEEDLQKALSALHLAGS
jgi:hypothetical protein